MSAGYVLLLDTWTQVLENIDDEKADDDGVMTVFMIRDVRVVNHVCVCVCSGVAPCIVCSFVSGGLLMHALMYVHVEEE